MLHKILILNKSQLGIREANDNKTEKWEHQSLNMGETRGEI